MSFKIVIELKIVYCLNSSMFPLSFECFFLSCCGVNAFQGLAFLLRYFRSDNKDATCNIKL